MVGTVRTARGEWLDMNALRRANEEVVAVSPAGGRMMNARGDILGPGGKIITTREELEKAYAQNIKNAVKHVSVSSDNITAESGRRAQPQPTQETRPSRPTPKPQEKTAAPSKDERIYTPQELMQELDQEAKKTKDTSDTDDTKSDTSEKKTTTRRTRRTTTTTS